MPRLDCSLAGQTSLGQEGEDKLERQKQPRNREMKGLDWDC